MGFFWFPYSIDRDIVVCFVFFLFCLFVCFLVWVLEQVTFRRSERAATAPSTPVLRRRTRRRSNRWRATDAIATPSPNVRPTASSRSFRRSRPFDAEDAIGRDDRLFFFVWCLFFVCSTFLEIGSELRRPGDVGRIPRDVFQRRDHFQHHGHPGRGHLSPARRPASRARTPGKKKETKQKKTKNQKKNPRNPCLSVCISFWL